MNREAYNGWTNYETWLASIWISSNEYEYNLLEKVKRCAGELHERADMLRAYYETDLRISLDLDGVFSDASLSSDLLRGAFGRINWAELLQDS
jgi:hypothetical protein